MVAKSTKERAGDIEFSLYRKKVKNINLRVRDDGEVCVSAPRYASLRTIRDFVISKSEWIKRIQNERDSGVFAIANNASEEDQRQWHELISAFAPPLVEKWEDVLGVRTGKLVLRNMKSRWGSCQPKTGRICLNTRLALYPLECLEYVVAHELCHLIVSGHGKDFHALMDSVMPDWKARRAKLR